MLITEVDRLSSAWQTLDVQNRDKVLNLMQHEEKVARLLSEKAKADNRYFAAMRAKEALTAENLVLTKASEKQSKALAASEEAAKAQGEYVVCALFKHGMCTQRRKRLRCDNLENHGA